MPEGPGRLALQQSPIPGIDGSKAPVKYHMFSRKPASDKRLTRTDIRVRDNIDQKGCEVFTGLNARDL